MDFEIFGNASAMKKLKRGYSEKVSPNKENQFAPFSRAAVCDVRGTIDLTICYVYE